MATTDEEEQRSRRKLFGVEVASNLRDSRSDSSLDHARECESQQQSRKRAAPVDPAPCPKRPHKSSATPYRCRDLPRRPIGDNPRPSPGIVASTPRRKLLPDVHDDSVVATTTTTTTTTTTISSSTSISSGLLQESRGDEEEGDPDASAAAAAEEFFVGDRALVVEVRREELVVDEQQGRGGGEGDEEEDWPSSPRTPPASSIPAAPLTPMAPMKRDRSMARPRPPPSAIHRRLNFDD